MGARQEEKSERSQRAILAAALRLFSTQGYRGTSSREIAAEAGLSTGSLYHHFPDKESLFRTLLDEYLEVLDSPDFPFNKALAEGAFPNDLGALARAAQESISSHRPHLNLIFVDVVEFEGTHLRKYYAEMPERFKGFIKQAFPGDTLEDHLAPGCHAATAVMLACRIYLQFFMVEQLFGVSAQFGLESSTTLTEIEAILSHGMLSRKAAGSQELAGT